MAPSPKVSTQLSPQKLDRVALLAAQQRLLAIKKTLQGGLNALKPIEARLNVALKALDVAEATNTATNTAVLPLFEQLLAATQQDGDAGFAAISAGISNADALALAKELGLRLKSKSQREIWRLLRLRVQQSLQLTVSKPQVTAIDD
jgi:hypothetical protein